MADEKVAMWVDLTVASTVAHSADCWAVEKDVKSAVSSVDSKVAM